MSDNRIEGCTSCYCCAKAGKCVLSNSDSDKFEDVYHRLISSDAILIITPVYSVIPSRLTALFERLTSVLFSTGLLGKPENPLCGKKVAVVNYCSNKICDETQIKLIFQKFLMSEYSYTDVNYNYINNCSNPNEKYGDVSEYVKDIVSNLA
jgi:multimeric flavodoxin WrbA